MDKNLLKGRWKELSGEVKRRWSELTDDDLTHIEGDREKLVGALQKRYARERKDVAQDVDRFFDELADRISSK